MYGDAIIFAFWFTVRVVSTDTHKVETTPNEKQGCKIFLNFPCAENGVVAYVHCIAWYCQV